MVDVIHTERVDKKARQDVLDFSRQFYINYGIYPIVLYSLNKDKSKTITLPDMEAVVNKLLFEKFGDTYDIRSKTRLRHIVMYRQIMFKILYDMGYTIVSIAKYFNYNHATILYSKDCVNDFLKLKDSQFLNVYNIIINEINQKNVYDDSVQSDDRGESDS